MNPKHRQEFEKAKSPEEMMAAARDQYEEVMLKRSKLKQDFDAEDKKLAAEMSSAWSRLSTIISISAA